ncbi:hypothetical protein N0V90_009058 [Kalmusia sp. IMI 367209]|nr:hypothetical protein N0V90_009058 [Kalmusia sp. IMI 367209]
MASYLAPLFSQTPVFPFLRLPRELREIIYKYWLMMATSTISREISLPMRTVIASTLLYHSLAVKSLMNWLV